VGGVKFVPNRSIADTMHFQKDKIAVQKGGTLTLIDRTNDLAVAHGAINPDTGEEQEPTTPLVNVGKAGFNQPGDSVIIPPGGRVKVKVTGGRDMSYLCAIHPWMLGKIDVPPLG
jgi:hypothetical protein